MTLYVVEIDSYNSYSILVVSQLLAYTLGTHQGNRRLVVGSDNSSQPLIVFRSQLVLDLDSKRNVSNVLFICIWPREMPGLISHRLRGTGKSQAHNCDDSIIYLLYHWHTCSCYSIHNSQVLPSGTNQSGVSTCTSAGRSPCMDTFELVARIIRIPMVSSDLSFQRALTSSAKYRARLLTGNARVSESGSQSR